MVANFIPSADQSRQHPRGKLQHSRDIYGLVLNKTRKTRYMTAFVAKWSETRPRSGKQGLITGHALSTPDIRTHILVF